MNRTAWRATPFAIGLWVVWLAVVTPRAAAEEPKPPGDARTRQFLLSGQEPAEPFVPLKPRTSDDVRRLEAIKYFCIGRWLENDVRWGEAFEAYKKALESDPKSLTIHKSLITLANLAGRRQDASKYLREAIELAPDDYELLDGLGSELVEQGQFDQAAEVYKRAVASPKLRQRDAKLVLLKFKLGMLSEQIKDYDGAADAYLDVMAAMQEPEAYQLHRLTGSNRPRFMQNPAETYENFGNTFRQAKRYEDALRAFRNAQANSPRRARFSLNIAEVYIDREEYAQALEHLDKYVEEQTPIGSTAYEKLAVVLEKLGRADEILPRVEAAAEKNRLNMNLQFYLGTLHEEAGHIDQAKAIYTKVLENRGDERVYKALARIHQTEDRFRDLIALLGSGLERAFEQRDGQAVIAQALDEQLKALVSDPETARKVVETAREMQRENSKQLGLGARYFVAKVAQAAEQIDAAAEFYRLCIETQPRAAPVFYRDWSKMLLAANRIPEAIAVLRESIDNGSRARDAEAHNELAIALQLDGQTEEALKAAARAIELEPDEAMGYVTQARVLTHAEQYDKAAQRYEQILRDFADRPEVQVDARYALSSIYVQLGDMPKAERQLELILEQDPDNDTANNDLGYLWADQGKNLQQAEGMIRKALESQPENAAYLDSMGWVLYRLDRPAEARKYLEDAVARQEGGQDGTIVDHLGDVYFRLKEFNKAREMWQRAATALENAKGARRDDKRLGEIREKLKSLEQQLKRDSGDD
jgi:tetratricopeptide (TPR) repeat protein